MQFILVDIADRTNFYPFSLTRSLAECRVGLYSFQERWEKYLGQDAGIFTENYLQVLYDASFLSTNESLTFINVTIVPQNSLLDQIKGLQEGEKLITASGKWIATKTKERNITNILLAEMPPIIVENVEWVENSVDLLKRQAAFIRTDFAIVSQNRRSQKVNDTNRLIQEDQIFIEEGAQVRAAVLNAEAGPIYLGKNSEVQEGALIRGPFALCEGSTVNMGAKLRGDTTIGPFSKVGGEVSNSVIMGYSNKGHDGFLGNSVIGEWCNLGADTNTSNLKNNYAPVKLWDYTKGGFANTGLQFCGLMMGDHSKCGINTMFNTGTVIGVGANVFGDGYPRNFIPSFAWGGAAGFSTFTPPKFHETAEAVYARRGKVWGAAEKEILDKVFELTKSYRIWDKTS